jgi:hypothetical protein
MQATPTETRAQTHLQTTTNLKLNRRHVWFWFVDLRLNFIYGLNKWLTIKCAFL